MTGLFTLVAGPVACRFSDRWGKLPLFCAGTALATIMVLIYTHLGPTPIFWVIVLNVMLFLGITARMISASALMSAVPEPARRGSFMSVNASIQQFAGGLAAAAAGFIVVQSPSGALARYDVLGYVVTASMLLSVGMLYLINRAVVAGSGRSGA